MDLIEIWKNIDLMPGYKISNFGRVKSSDTEFFTYGGTRKSRKFGRILKPRKVSHGYLAVHSSNKSFLIHRLVAEAFLVKSNSKTQVNHKDGNKSNNVVTNLEWCTPSENCKHAHKTGLRIGLIGEKNPMAKFSNEDILLMKELRKTTKVVNIAKIFNANAKYISSVLAGKVRNK